jgi:hypothetical protein
MTLKKLVRRVRRRRALFARLKAMREARLSARLALFFPSERMFPRWKP